MKLPQSLMNQHQFKRELHSLGNKRRVVCKKMGIREANRKKRLQYARGKVHWSVDRNWKHVIISDEMTTVKLKCGEKLLKND